MNSAPALGAASVLLVFAIVLAYLAWFLKVIIGLSWLWAGLISWVWLMPGGFFGGYVGFQIGCWFRARAEG